MSYLVFELKLTLILLRATKPCAKYSTVAALVSITINLKVEMMEIERKILLGVSSPPVATNVENKAN